MPPEILNSYPGKAYLDQRFHWTELKVTTQVVSHNNPEEDRPPLRKYEQARVLGGGSSINGQLANRGAPTDFDEWAERGAKGWNWDAVLPYFKKIERDMDFGGPYHGNEGRIPVRRIFPDLWNGYSKAAAEALTNAGYEYLPDQNGEFKEGYFPITSSNAYERRVSAAIGYLDPRHPAAREPHDLDPYASHRTLIRRPKMCRRQSPRRRQGNRAPRQRSDTVVRRDPLAGPPVARRDRPAMHLNDLGIPVRANSAGVGQRLMDHPSIAGDAFIHPDGRINDYTGRHALVGMRYSSGIEGAPMGDMFALPIAKSSCGTRSANRSVPG